MNSNLKRIIFQDLYRCTGKKDKKTYLYFYFKEPTFRFTVLLRKYQFYRNHNRILSFILKKRLRSLRLKFGLWIPDEIKIGKGFYIGHIGTIIINSKVIIGDNVNINQGVTIGQTNRGEKKGCPIIGNDVWFGTNSVVVGKITIGNNVLIAPNSYVNINVPDNSIVIGNPAIIKSNKEATKDYICNKV